jgi:crotonobetainyl-CoA:carnitine CoA-transferase CaiB-like acyl-CoA transferase
MATPRPLAGMKVVELAQFIAGPTAAQLLADFGAEVIKVEPASGDGSRALPGTRFGSGYFRCFNTSKTSRVVDLRDTDGLSTLDELLGEADALVCNMAPSTLRRGGIDPQSLATRFPELVITLVSGFGQHDDRTCMDTIAQCESGFAWLNGDADGAPRVSTSWPVDFFSGMYAALATSMAMLDTRSPRGTIVDLSMMEVASAILLGPAAVLASEGATPAAPTGNRDRAASPCNIYRCADGHVYIYGGLDPYWAKLRPLVGGEDAPFSERLARAEEFDATVEAWTSARSRDTVLAELARISVPAGAVRHPVEAIGIIRQARPGAVTMAQPDGQHVPGFPALFSGERIDRRPAPALGTDMKGQTND